MTSIDELIYAYKNNEIGKLDAFDQKRLKRLLEQPIEVRDVIKAECTRLSKRVAELTDEIKALEAKHDILSDWLNGIEKGGA